MRTVLSLVAGSVVVLASAVSVPAAAAGGVRVLGVAQIARQSVPTPSPGQSDVVVQSQLATSPEHPQLAAAVTETGLQTTPAGTFGVAVSLAVTRNGGASWTSRVVPGITVAAGGSWQGASWPTVAVGPDGAVYVVASVRSNDPCHTGLGVVRSSDGGRTFARMVLVENRTACGVLDGRSSLAVDDGVLSPHRGRLYLAWTSYRSKADGTPIGQVQTLSRSGTDGRTWAAPVDVTAADSSTFGNTVLVGPDGRVTDVYGANSADFRHIYIDASTSHDGGRTFDPEVRISHDRPAHLGATDIRCCAPSAAVDPVTGELYAAFGDSRLQGGDYEDALVFRSSDGSHWTGPVQADVGGPSGLEHLTPEVAAYDATVSVTWAVLPDPDGTVVRQQVAVSRDGGQSFGPATTLGPDGDLTYAALANGFGYWLGDVTGIAAVAGRTYLAWPLPSAPPGHGTQHQTMWGATVATS